MKRAAIVALLTLLGAACARGQDAAPGARLLPLSGAVLLGGDQITEPSSVGLGEIVRTGPGGRARLDLGGGQFVDLAPGTRLRLGSPQKTDLLEGSVLAQATAGVSVGLGPAQAQGSRSIFRVDRFPDRIRVYSGQTTVPGSGWDGAVPSFRQVGVVGGTVLRAPEPLEVDPDDPWDRRLLGPAIDIGLGLDRLQHGFQAQVPARQGADALPELGPRSVPGGALRSALDERSARSWPEVLVASVVADRAAPQGAGTGRLLRDVLDLRDLGASWILVAAQWELTQAVLATLSEVSGALADVLAALAPPPGAAGPGGVGGGGTGVTTDGTGGSITPDGGGGGGGGDGGGGGGGGCADGDVVCDVIDPIIPDVPGTNDAPGLD